MYVSPNGTDVITSGTDTAPFKTIMYALENTNGAGSKAVAGDTILLKGGRYREASIDLNGYKGTAAQPITIKAVDGTNPILDGTNRIKSTWTATDSVLHPETVGKPIFQITLDYAAYQLWENKEPLKLARFPNAEAWSDKMWDRYEAMRFEHATATNGIMVDDESITTNSDTIAGAGISFTDTMILKYMPMLILG